MQKYMLPLSKVLQEAWGPDVFKGCKDCPTDTNAQRLVKSVLFWQRFTVVGLTCEVVPHVRTWGAHLNY